MGFLHTRAFAGTNPQWTPTSDLSVIHPEHVPEAICIPPPPDASASTLPARAPAQGAVRPACIAGRDREAPCVGRDDETRAVRGRARQNRATAGRGDDSTRRRDRVRAPRCGPGLEGHRREPARSSWDVAQWAGSGKTQVTRQDRASCGLRNPKGRLRIANHERNSF
jgi:hypothetical protein